MRHTNFGSTVTVLDLFTYCEVQYVDKPLSLRVSLSGLIVAGTTCAKFGVLTIFNQIIVSCATSRRSLR